MMFQQDGRPGTGANANLKEHLGSKTMDELKKELEAIFEKEERTGEMADPQLVAAYCAAMEQMAAEDPTQLPGNFEESWATFVKNHPDLFPTEKTKTRNASGQVRRVAELIILAAAVLVLSAAAFQWPDHIITWGKELFHMAPAEKSSGVMELPEPNADGYSSLAQAVADLGPEEVGTPTWIPEGFVIDSIIFQEAQAYTSVTALYITDDLKLMVRITYYFDQSDMPDWMYEKNEDREQEVYIKNGVEHLLTKNFDRLQVTWKNGNYLYNISGLVTEAEIKRMVNSIYGG